MKKTTIILFALLLVSVLAVAGYTIKVGTFEKEINEDVANLITADLTDTGQSLDEAMGNLFIEKYEKEYIQKLKNQGYRLTEEIIMTEDTAKIKELIESAELILGIGGIGQN